MSRFIQKKCPLFATGLVALMAVACSSESSGLLGIETGGAKKKQVIEKEKVDDVSGDATKNPDVMPPTNHDDHPDEPVWVNGVYLTCAWAEVIDETRAAIACETSGEPVPGTPAYEWSLKGPDGKSIASGTTIDATVQRFELGALALYDALATVQVRLGKLDKTFMLPLKNGLSGFANEGQLDECLRAGKSALASCMSQVGVTVGTPTASTEQASTPPAQATPKVTTGKVVGGFNWHLIQPGKSCVDACNELGGVTLGTVSFAGASKAACQEIATAFGFGATQGNPSSMPCDVGCYIAYNELSWWYGGANVTQECKGNNVMARFCSCVE